MQRSIHNVPAASTFAPAPEGHDILRDLFELLEDYAPMWYSEDHRNRLAAMLGEPILEPSIH